MAYEIGDILRAELSELLTYTSEKRLAFVESSNITAGLKREVEDLERKIQSITGVLCEYGISYNDIWEDKRHAR